MNLPIFETEADKVIASMKKEISNLKCDVAHWERMALSHDAAMERSKCETIRALRSEVGELREIIEEWRKRVIEYQDSSMVVRMALEWFEETRTSVAYERLLESIREMKR